LSADAADAAGSQIAELFRDSGLEGWVCARNLDDGSSIAYRADEPVVMASLYKLPVLIAFARQWAGGTLDPAREVTLRPSHLTSGPTGLSTLTDPVTTSLRNLAVLMATLSDDAAADVVLEAVGHTAIAQTLADARLCTTAVRSSSSQAQQSLLRQTKVRSLPRAFERLASNDALYGDRVYDPTLMSPTTAADMVQLLDCLWSGELVAGEPLEFVKQTLRSQIWPHRLRAGFPYAAAKVAGKTGTLGALRHEVGVVELPHEPPYAVAVLTRAARGGAVLPAAERAIGHAASMAVARLRLGL